MTDGHPHAAHGGRLAGLDHPLRNRVSPSGEIFATTHRGTMYGNRGVLHNDDLALVRRFQVRRWLVCVLEFRGRRRPVLRPGRYTELFFLDEAVALAAGHRPCAECRHLAYQSFRIAWATALALPAKPAADDTDQVLHRERRLAGGARITYPAPLSELPDGVFIVRDGDFWLPRRSHYLVLKYGVGYDDAAGSLLSPIICPGQPESNGIGRNGAGSLVHGTGVLIPFTSQNTASPLAPANRSTCAWAKSVGLVASRPRREAPGHLSAPDSRIVTRAIRTNPAVCVSLLLVSIPNSYCQRR